MSEKKQTVGEALEQVSGLGQKEIREIWSEVKENHAKLNGCTGHDFVRMDEVGKPLPRYLCANCGGTVDTIAYTWYQRGRDHARQEQKVWPDLVAPPMYENPAEGWDDPALPDIRLIWQLAKEVGYAVGIHGSLKRDFDLIAAPWTEDAVGNEELIAHISAGLNVVRTFGPEAKPHGRIGVVLQLGTWHKNIDLSIMPKQN